MTDKLRMRDMAFEIDPIAQLVVDGAGRLVLVNERARLQFGLSVGDMGRPFCDLELSFRPTDLRSAIQEASTERRPAYRLRSERRGNRPATAGPRAARTKATRWRRLCDRWHGQDGPVRSRC